MRDDLIDMSIGQDYAEIREAVARLCEAFSGAYWRELERGGAPGRYPTDFIQALTDAGYLSALIPEEYGGAGLPLRAAAVILETICATGCAAGACHAQMYVMGVLLRHGDAEQKRKYLPEIAAGRLRLQAFGVTEPGAGSDTTRIQTRAERCDGGYVVTGQKIWTSRAEYSDLMLLLARTSPREQVEKPHHGLSVFLFDLREAQQRGCRIRPIETMINHHATEVFFDETPIPAEALIGEEGAGFRYILDGMNAERCLIAAESIGNGRYFLEKAARYAREREVFGRPIGQNQGVQFPLARAQCELEAADLLTRKACALYDADRPCGAEASMAHYLAAEAAWSAGEACFATFGGFAFAAEYDIERKWREARLYRTAPISPNLTLSHIAQHVLGLPKSY